MLMIITKVKIVKIMWRLIGSQSNLQVGECEKWQAGTVLLDGNARHC